MTSGEIDARVEAAKKELREEMRAQAATVAATSAGSSWETEAATHRKLDLLELHGYFRVRPELFHKFDLDQPPDFSGYWLFPRPDGTGRSGDRDRRQATPSPAPTCASGSTPPSTSPRRCGSAPRSMPWTTWCGAARPQYAYIRQDRVDIGILGSQPGPEHPRRELHARATSR